ncbi:MAG: AMP-binding protein [Clostridiales bacterium]|nr:AMP-binding protein [Clostridiales bacterium]
MNDDKRKKARQWAEEIVSYVDNDPRPVVKCKESRTITDLKDLLVSSAELYGDNIAYLQKWDPKGEFQETTYRQALEDVNGLGTALLARGLGGKRVAVIGENCYQWCSTYLAVTGGVGCIVPLDKELSADELKEQIKRAEVSCVVFAKKHEAVFRQIRDDGDTPLEFLVSFNAEEEKDGVLSWRGLIEEGGRMIGCGDRSYIDAEVDNEAMSILIFTSGTTGKAKGVMLCQKNICAELMIAPTTFELREDDRYMSFLPLHHTYECTCCFLMAIYKGSSVGFCQGLKYITKNLKELRPTMMLGVPALYEKLYSSIWKNVRKQGKEKTLRRVIKINRKTKKIGIDLGNIFFKQIRDIFGGRMKTLICGGAKINPEILDGLHDFGFNALQGYGLTEAAPMGAFNPQDAPNSRSIGIPFPGQSIKTINVNEEGIGEICIKGPNIMMGYYQQPEETAKAIDEEGWFHTGDLGYIDDDGYAYLTGRQKNVIITKNGKNVYPEEMEYQISNIDFVEESFVFGQESSIDSDVVITASVKVDKDAVREILGEGCSDDDTRKLIWSEIDAINEAAPLYRKIRKVILRKSAFVKNTSQKIIRFAEENKKEE